MSKKRHGHIFAIPGSGAGEACRCGKKIEPFAPALYSGGRWVHKACFGSKKRRSRSRTPRRPVAIRQSPLGPADYERYMQGRTWTRRKQAYFSAHPKRCVICDGNVKIHLHHMTYERLGCELDEDLVALCELHHAGAHEHHKIYKGSLKEATLRYVERLQQIYS